MSFCDYMHIYLVLPLPIIFIARTKQNRSHHTTHRIKGLFVKKLSFEHSLYIGKYIIAKAAFAEQGLIDLHLVRFLIYFSNRNGSTEKTTIFSR